MEEYNYRISKISFILMLLTAMTIDGIQALLDLIPFLGWILSSLLAIPAFLIFWIWLKIKGVGLLDRGLRMLALWTITPMIEVTFSFFPGLTIMIVLTYVIVRVDDELDRKEILSRENQDKIGGLLTKTLKNNA
ncbi:MAG: hypothetical protein KAJ58_00375 [Candidatus Pacebacteria bacterium]|nr:hypothetical protein [Candidatus Paceibacterota bacterium]